MQPSTGELETLAEGDVTDARGWEDRGCTKRGWPSEHQARRAHRAAGWRLRAYRCPECGLFHVTNQEKNR